MALTISGTTPAVATGTGLTVTTASFTPPAGALLVALIAQSSVGANDDTSVTGVAATAGGAFTRQLKHDKASDSDGGAGAPGGVEIWTATASGAAITVTGTKLLSGAGYDWILKVMVLTDTGTPTVGQKVVGHNTPADVPTIGLTGLTVGSYVFAVSSDWNAKGLASFGSGQTMIDEYQNSAAFTGHVWRTTAVLAGTTQTMNQTAPTGENWNIAAVEIKASSAGGAPATATASVRIGGAFAAKPLRTRSGGVWV